MENPRKRLLEAARYRAKRSGQQFTITEDDILIPDYCPILGIPLQVSCPGFNRSSPSLDRIDSTRGYTPDNIQVISNRANILKRDGSLRELALLGSWALRTLNNGSS